MGVDGQRERENVNGGKYLLPTSAGATKCVFLGVREELAACGDPPHGPQSPQGLPEPTLPPARRPRPQRPQGPPCSAGDELLNAS